MRYLVFGEPQRVNFPTLSAVCMNLSQGERDDFSEVNNKSQRGSVLVMASVMAFAIKMYIRGQTLYSCFDEVNNIVPMNCNDALGLISEKWVLVSDRLPGWHYGIMINAGIATLRGSFSVDRVYTYAQEHQSLFVYGSIAQYHRGIVHRGSCGSGVGYCQKDYKYDDRFRKNPPPHFISIENRKPVYREDFYVG